MSARPAIFLTGATGHLGAVVLRQLVLSGTRVCVLGRHRPPPLPGVRFLHADFSRPASLLRHARALRAARSVVHLAAVVPQGAGATPDIATLYQTNVLGSVVLASLLPKRAHLVFASTVEVYGRPVKKGVLTASSPTGPATVYGRTKLAAEQALGDMARERRFDLAILRFASIYGPGETIDRATSRFARAAAAGRALPLHGSGEEKRNPLYVEDAARAVIAAMRTQAQGIIPVGGAEVVSVRALAERTARAAGRRPRFARRPAPRGPDLVLDTRRAERLLGFRPQVALADGLRMTAKHLRGVAPTVVFDVDGTLLDVSARYAAIHRDLAAACGFRPLSAAAYGNLKRRHVPEEEILRRCSRDADARRRYLSRRGRLLESRTYLRLDRPFPGVLAALRTLSRSVPLTALSLRGDARALRRQLGRCGILPHLQSLLSAPAGKDPLRAKIALLRSLPYSAMIVAGDTEVDGALAAANGVPFFAVTSGIRTPALLRASRPDFLSATVTDLPRVLQRYRFPGYGG